MKERFGQEGLEELVAQFIERREHGERLDIESFVRAHPKLAERLKPVLAALVETELLIPNRDETLPQDIGPYRVIRELGRGGMGRVLEVEASEKPGEFRALKLLELPRAAPERAFERFRREGEILRRLEHPGIVRVHDLGFVGARPYLVMDRVAGQSLSEWLNAARARRDSAANTTEPVLELPGTGSVSVRAAALVARLARAVSALHSAGFVHRDLKPANVILKSDGTPVLVDFGLVHESSSETLTHTGDLLGTPQYMSPEQARGERVDDRADVWGLGCVLYELLTLHPPRSGTDPVRVLEAVRKERIQPVRRLAPSVPVELARIVERALAHQRRYRTSNVDLLAADLEAFCAGRPVQARAPSIAERVARAWTFDRKYILTGCLVLLAAAVTVPLLQWRRERVLAADQEIQRRVLADWMGDEHARARAGLEELSPAGRDDPWNSLLADLVMERELGEPSVPSGAADAVNGWRLVLADKPKDALPHLRAAASAARSEPIAAVLLADAAERAGELTQAAGEYSAAARLMPGAGIVDARLARVHYSMRRWDDAQRAAERAVELLPGHAASWELLARLHYKKGEHPRGIECARRALELAGQEATVAMRKTLAALLDKTEQFTESQEILRAIVDEDPNSVENYTGLAFSYDLSHDVRAAYETYERAMLLGPHSKLYVLQSWLLCGISRKTCERCAAAYVTDPSLFDPDRAEQLALDALACERGWDPSTPTVVAQIANELGRTVKIRAALEKMQAQEQRDNRLAALTRGLRMLDQRR